MDTNTNEPVMVDVSEVSSQENAKNLLQSASIMQGDDDDIKEYRLPCDVSLIQDKDLEFIIDYDPDVTYVTRELCSDYEHKYDVKKKLPVYLKLYTANSDFVIGELLKYNGKMWFALSTDTAITLKPVIYISANIMACNLNETTRLLVESTINQACDMFSAIEPCGAYMLNGLKFNNVEAFMINAYNMIKCMQEFRWCDDSKQSGYELPITNWRATTKINLDKINGIKVEDNQLRLYSDDYRGYVKDGSLYFWEYERKYVFINLPDISELYMPVYLNKYLCSLLNKLSPLKKKLEFTQYKYITNIQPEIERFTNVIESSQYMNERDYEIIVDPLTIFDNQVGLILLVYDAPFGEGQLAIDSQMSTEISDVLEGDVEYIKFEGIVFTEYPKDAVDTYFNLIKYFGRIMN